MLPKIAITMGDPAGIGPEVVVLAHAREELFSWCRPVVYGDPAILRRAMMVTGSSLAIVGEGEATGPGRVAVDARSALDPDQVPFGRPSLPGSVAMAGYIRSAAEDVLSGKAAAIVTCPVTKEGLKSAGVPFPGHTEFLAHLCGGAEVVMM
ncbi:MAG: 4-hydroxythreonine-4-phosphate dehydrogenase, partial [Deltaproteobacteria bacterium]|nr:4-hydroxythreonine-4-phosphate dehydrogenase [Deltaproteobacteria bacterium]